MEIIKRNNLPDVALESSLDLFAPLNWVGMEDIPLPVVLEIEGQKTAVAARIDAQVSLDKNASRGIHMSRLYALVQDSFSSRDLTATALAQISEEFLASHQDLSSASRIRVKLDLPVRRQALKSERQAWRTYPVTWMLENRSGQTRFWLEVEVAYSSTCPASAALSRQLIQENFKAHFSSVDLSFQDVHHWLGTTQGILATPHAQRSYAQVAIEVAVEDTFSIFDLIDRVEDALQTPVQTIVKREDEQEFALRNGQNLMFCEDAARKIQKILMLETAVRDYTVHVSHHESLHPHNAVSFLSKNPQSRLKSTW